MTHRPNEVYIDPQDPWAGDDLKRAEFGNTFASFLKSLSGPFVVAVEAPWGAGKSTFLRRLQFHLEADARIPVVRVDAWRNDYLQDPMIAFIAAIQRRIVEKNGRATAKAKRLAKDIAHCGIALSGAIVKVATRATAPGLNETVDALAELASSVGNKLLDFQSDHERSQTEFAKALIEARDYLSNRRPTEPVRPLVFMVDELDRCRPDFAVRALERIKHFFDVKGIIFLLATDGANLPAAIASVYGPQTDSERYLRKFIDYKFHLGEPSPNDFSDFLFKSYGMEDFIPGDLNLEQAIREVEGVSTRYRTSLGADFIGAELRLLFPEIAGAMSLSLRDQIQAFIMIACILRSVPQGFQILSATLCYCVCARFEHYETYLALRAGTISVPQLVGVVSAEASLHRPGIRSLGKATPAGIALRFEATALKSGSRTNFRDSIGALQKTFQGDERFTADIHVDRSTIVAERFGRFGEFVDYVPRLLRMAEAFAPSR